MRPRPLPPFLLVLLATFVVAAGCGRAASPRAAEAVPGDPAAAVPGAAASGSTAGSSGADAPASDSEPLVVFLGDSLSAGYGLPAEDAFPTLVGERLRAAGTPVRVVNAGVSGDTSAGGLARADWVLRQQPDLLVVELGANDGLRALPVDALERNLRTIVEKARAAGAGVLLVGMRLPPNYGADYVRGFEGVYPKLARELDVPLVPFLLEGVAGRPELNLPDGIHPTTEGHRIVADLVTPYVASALRAHLAAQAEQGAAAVAGASR